MGDNKLKQPMRAYLFGYPLHQSLAPLLHSTIYKNLDIPWTYDLIESKDKMDLLPRLQADDCIGSAITMPHKVAWTKECDEVTEEGQAIGAINTVFVRGEPATGQKCYIGTNTDCVGVREAFLQNFPDILDRSKGRPALVIGGGGACRSAVYALHKWLGASPIYLVNRLKGEVDGIIECFEKLDPPPKLLHVSTIEHATSLEAPVCVVGTVPDFAAATSGEIEAKNITNEFLRKAPKGYVLEMCYHPNVITEFYRSAESNGWRTLPGTEAMIYQGVTQAVLWTNIPLSSMPLDAAKAAIAEALDKRAL